MNEENKSILRERIHTKDYDIYRESPVNMNVEKPKICPSLYVLLFWPNPSILCKLGKLHK